MVIDPEWLKAKSEYEEFIHLEEQKALWRRKLEFIMAMDITTKFQYNGFNVEVTETFKDVKTYAEWLNDMQEKGFTKPVYAKTGGAEVREGFGVVETVEPGEKTKNGKQMYAVTIKLEDGSKIKVNKFNPTEFRKGDDVKAFKNDSGYQDAKLVFEDGTDIPF